MLYGIAAMYRCLLIFTLIFTAAAMPLRAQNAYADTLDVVNWNLEWWGSGNPHNTSTQVAKTRQLMQAMNADVYALCEIVNVDSFISLTNSLGNGAYDWFVSPFGSQAPSPSSGYYAGAQKLGFIYRKSMLRNITAKALLAGSSTAYYSFASGRYPYDVSAEVLGKDAQWRRIDFIILHAKAQTDATSCSRRTDGCKELKDSLDAYYPAARFLLLGDYNDDLDHTICSGGGPSNYLYMVKDSAHYKSITLPLERSGAISIDGYSSLIDNVIASDEMYRYYVPGTAQSLRSFVKGIDPNYNTDVSDHFPVRTRYMLDAGMNTSVAETAFKEGSRIFPNPATDYITISFTDGGVHQYTLLNASGTTVLAGTAPDATLMLRVGTLPAGIYCLLLRNENGQRKVQQLSIVR